MDKKQIKETLNVLSMVSGDCPFERGVSEKPKEGECYGEINCVDCVDCWKVALSQELKNMEEKE